MPNVPTILPSLPLQLIRLTKANLIYECPPPSSRDSVLRTSCFLKFCCQAKRWVTRVKPFARRARVASYPRLSVWSRATVGSVWATGMLSTAIRRCAETAVDYPVAHFFLLWQTLPGECRCLLTSADYIGSTAFSTYYYVNVPAPGRIISACSADWVTGTLTTRSTRPISRRFFCTRPTGFYPNVGVPTPCPGVLFSPLIPDEFDNIPFQIDSSSRSSQHTDVPSKIWFKSP